MKEKQLSIYGSTGFVGSNFMKIYPKSLGIDRESRCPKSSDILYLISTTDNYNVLNDSFVDIDTNLRVLMETLDECRSYGIDTFNFISSWFVYGEVPLPANEKSYCDPKGFYSITKRCAEQLLISYCDTFGIDYRILRLCNVYGTTDKKASKKRNALQYLISRLKRGEEIPLYDGGEFYRNYMHVVDICRSINTVCSLGQKNEIYNIGSTNNYQFRDLIKIAVDETRSSSKIVSIPPPEFHKTVQVKDMLLDTKKLYQLGFEESITIEEGIRKLCED